MSCKDVNRLFSYILLFHNFNPSFAGEGDQNTVHDLFSPLNDSLGSIHSVHDDNLSAGEILAEVSHTPPIAFHQ